METTEIAPEYLRVDAVMVMTSLSRSYLYALIREGKIRSKMIRRPGRHQGVRLVNVESVREFIEGHSA